MKTDILTVVDTGYDASTGFYVNGRLEQDVHCNDEHEIPDRLYELMTEYNFAKVERKRLTDAAYETYCEDRNYLHPPRLDAYTDEDFE
ncbi:hypothetical protein [Paenibacillus tundrae]|uniref:Uncharacterized protein n=1 Tax=Paenibacillus tundrae TaxID=528187 RepID=A0ABT9W645_9BACL|nr:hypothetical protein [Paenibacillus tundrae]MDQ0168727.1 hypothetical protein [Paenibacillus tundrae]